MQLKPDPPGSAKTVITKIVSGGQTGVDRAALDVALELGIDIGGWVPLGRRAEDGTVPDRYVGLLECGSEAYETRTELNVRDSDATLILAFGPLAGGTALTRQIAARLSKPQLAIDLSEAPLEGNAARVKQWLASTRPPVLNIAGPRASEAPGLGDSAAALLRLALRDGAAASSGNPSRNIAQARRRAKSEAKRIIRGEDAMGEAINGDLSVRAAADTTRMEWMPSPSGSVWRKRVHLVGPPESGQVTSVVRYEPDSRFPPHDHPGGEEILVLEGVFSDEHGDWPAGTFLLNPEGFRHTPFSEPGCILFVKLRQFPGRGRRHVVVDTNEVAWEPSAIPGVACKALYEQDGFSDVIRIECWEPQADLGIVSYQQGAELFVLEGEFLDEAGTYSAGSWTRLPAGSEHQPRSVGGCTLYVKESGLPYLTTAAERSG